MARVVSFDDRQLGRGTGDFFKVTGTEIHPQTIAYIPGEAYEEELVPSAELKKKITQGDREAIERMDSIVKLKDVINQSMNKRIPGAEVWVNETGRKCILYAKAVASSVFWIEDVGYVFYKEGIPEECLGKGVMEVASLVVLEYELDHDGNIKMIPDEQALEIEPGHKLKFRYQLKVGQFKSGEIRAWQEHGPNNPLIKCDYTVCKVKQGAFNRTKFSPAGPAFWREDEVVRNRIIREARKIYTNIHKTGAKDFTVDEVLKCFPSLGFKPKEGAEPQGETSVGNMPETNFAELLGKAPEEDLAPPPKEQVTS